MTYAPASLTAVRSLLLAHLPGLDPVSVGIVGDAAHRGGYHCGSNRVTADDYSVRESSRDRSGLTEAASALDIGQWSTRVDGKTHDLRSMSIWLVAQCKAGAPDSRDIREIIYSPDGATVRRWDRLGKRTTGDSSHRWHTHISYHRDAIKAGRDQTALYRRYLSEIGLVQEDDMFEPNDRKMLTAVNERLNALVKLQPAVTSSWSSQDPKGTDQLPVVPLLAELVSVVQELRARPATPVELDYDQLADALLRRVAATPPA